MSEHVPTRGRRQPGCVHCRERHLKCDRQRPTCSNCDKSKHAVVCRYERRQTDQFRQSRYVAQSMPNVSPPLFTQALSPPNQDLTPEGSVQSCPPAEQAEWLSQGSGVARRTDSNYSHSTAPTGLRHEVQSSQYPAMQLISQGRHSSETDTEDGHAGSGPYPGQVMNLLDLPIMPDRPVWTPSRHEKRHSLSLTPPRAHRPSSVLTNPLECEVFGFFISHVAYWLDIGSPSRYFQSRVPPLAIEEPILLYACLARASHVMALRSDMDKSVEEHYMGKVLELLIPLLSSEQATCSNHTLLSTTVILRMSEQFTDISHDSQRHLNGAASLFMDGTVWAGIETDLAVASFWTHLRESIRICFLNEQPCLMNLARFELWFEEGSFSASLRLSDELWTNRITYLLLKVCNLCWHQEPAAESPAMSRGAEVDKIKSLVRQWRDSLPASFTPWCARKGDNQPFPVVRCFDSWHVVAWQFYYTAKVMLAIYFSDIQPRANLHPASQYIEAEVVEPIRWLCGLCIASNTNIGTNLNGSHLMGWCGQFLSGREEQRYLLAFLRQFGQRTKWPNDTSCERLERAWERSRKSWTEC